MNTTTTGTLSGTAHGIAYTGRWHIVSAPPLALAAVVHLAGRQPVALELGQLSGQVVDVGAALPALHSMVERQAALIPPRRPAHPQPSPAMRR